MLKINEVGAWSFKDATPTGIVLGLFWALAAGLLLGIPVWMARKIISGAPFCEACGKWGKTRELLHMKCAELGALRKSMEAKNFEPLASQEKAAPDARFFYVLYLQGCGNCDTTQTLCVDEVTITVNRKGQKSTKRKKIINRLMLTPEETVAVATAVAQVNVGPLPANNP